MRNITPILLVASILALCAVVSHGATPPANIRVLSCTTGGNTYATVAPTAAVSMLVSASATGSPSVCGLPAAFPQSHYVRTTLDGGKTWQWTYRLADFGFPTVPPVTPPVTPPVVVSIPPQVWTCTSDNITVTCKSPVVPGATP